MSRVERKCPGLTAATANMYLVLVGQALTQRISFILLATLLSTVTVSVEPVSTVSYGEAEPFVLG